MTPRCLGYQPAYTFARDTAEAILGAVAALKGSSVVLACGNRRRA
jgi:hypothetical protein